MFTTEYPLNKNQSLIDRTYKQLIFINRKFWNYECQFIEIFNVQEVAVIEKCVFLIKGWKRKERKITKVGIIRILKIKIQSQ